MRTEYTHEDGEEVLRRAIAIDAVETHAKDVVRRTADELGLSPEAVAQAEREYFAEKRKQGEVQEFVRHQRASFFSHLGSYLIVNAFLFFIDVARDHSISWAYYPLLGWGIGLAFHAMGTFNTRGEDFQKEFETWRAQRKASEDR